MRRALEKSVLGEGMCRGPAMGSGPQPYNHQHAPSHSHAYPTVSPSSCQGPLTCLQCLPDTASVRLGGSGNFNMKFEVEWSS
jgi:hypothetical protein